MKSKAIVKYLEMKNKIIYDATGLILTPNNAIKEEYTRGELKTILRDISMEHDGKMCPYCLIYYSTNNEVCNNLCPMIITHNNCSSINSTYKTIVKKLDNRDLYIKVHSFHNELKEAIETLKSELKEELEE